MFRKKRKYSWNSDIYNQTTWKRRGITGINWKNVDKLILKPIEIVIIVIAIGAFCGWRAAEEIKHHQQIVKQQEYEKHQAEMKRQEEIEKEQKKIRAEEKRRKEEERKLSAAVSFDRQRDYAWWGMVKKKYPKGTYVLNIGTMQKGKVIDYQGDRVFTDMDWWFDSDGLEPIEIIGYKEYRQYVKYVRGN